MAVVRSASRRLGWSVRTQIDKRFRKENGDNGKGK
jgi:hypothetical protein